jgi:ADP-heptose:LPS heptosyltransferase
MKPDFYRKRWMSLKEKPVEKELHRLARQIALSFLDRYFYNDHHDEEYIGLLCEMATFFDADTLNKAGASALFGIVVEGLCDDFEELQTEAYNKVMSQVVAFCRTRPVGTELATRLGDFELESYEDILGRIEQIRAGSDASRTLSPPPEKIFLLSRVTIGADVAITSILIQRLKRLFPNAEMILIGGGKSKDIFGGNPSIRIKEVHYSRHGNMMDRFASWFRVLEAIHEEVPEEASAGIIVVDPDSRLSQLGVLPLVAKDKYVFFNSRGKDSYPKKMSIAELTNHWMDRVLGDEGFCYPTVWLKESNLEKAARFAALSRNAGCRKIIAMNFGVGENSRKRLKGDFEEKLILKLLQEPDTIIVLDQGFGDEESGRSRLLVETARAHGHSALCTAFKGLDEIRMSQGIVGVQAGIGEIAALISRSDEFIGYDSACQHIAAALAIPTYTVFAGSNNPRFIRRWTACGPSKSEVIHVDTLTHPPMFDMEDVIARIIDARSE